MRTAQIARKTAETEIDVRINLDGAGSYANETGVGFFDHMLDQLARHSLIDMEVRAKGDLHIDDHHTVEDTGITLGQALTEALGDKRGIRRYGECHASRWTRRKCGAALDLSGRAYPGVECRDSRRPRSARSTPNWCASSFTALLTGIGGITLACRSGCTGSIRTTSPRRRSRRWRGPCGWRWRPIPGRRMRCHRRKGPCDAPVVRRPHVAARVDVRLSLETSHGTGAERVMKRLARTVPVTVADLRFSDHRDSATEVRGGVPAISGCGASRGNSASIHKRQQDRLGEP